MSGLLILALACLGLQAPPERQVHWERSLDDALAIARAEGRPILVALNMDGESACERIVREDYRDPEFVALTRRFVCVIGSVFRHVPRDHDDRGRRILCPRLGEVTCGEHIALEPVLFDRFLGGERVAPRHALVLEPSKEDGEKAFDLFYLFDLGDLREALAKAQPLGPPPSEERTLEARTWAELAAGKRHVERLALETRLDEAEATLEDICPRVPSEAVCAEAAGVLLARGDRGAIEPLRILLASAGRSADASCADLVTAAAEGLGVQAEAAAAVRETIALERAPALIPALSRLSADEASGRTLVLSYLALGRPEEAASAQSATGVADGARPLDGAAALALARALGRSFPAAPAPAEELRSAHDLEAELAELDGALTAAPGDPALQERMGRAALDLARRRIETGGQGIDLLLADAERYLALASDAKPRDAGLLLLRARTAYHRSDFEAQERFAREAFHALPPLPAEARTIYRALAGDPELAAELALGDPKAIRARYGAWAEQVVAPRERLEALRWLGDASARLLAARSGGDPAAELEGLRGAAWSLALVALSPAADETDWTSLASFCGALGRRREEADFARAGLERFPESSALHGTLLGAFSAAGRPELAAQAADEVAARAPASATCLWYAGLAHFLVADWERRGEEPDRAIAAYRRAAARFASSAERVPAYAETAGHYVALAALGRGFAHLLADRRADAAAALAEGIRLRPSIATVRDGLEREALDLLDGALEWRASGSSPVDPLALLEQLAAADPGNAFWARSISDSEVREGRRATRRGDPVAGEAYLRRSIEAARRATALADDEEDRKALAQASSMLAELLLERGDAAGAREPLAEAAALLGKETPAPGAGVEELRELAGRLRGELGEAGPIVRPGR